MSENNKELELVEAEIVKDNDGKKARQKAKNKRFFNDVFAPILLDIILLAFGICLLIWADKVTDFISIAIGAIFIVYSLYNFIDYIRADKDHKRIANLITGIAMLIAGIFLCVQTGFIKEAISFVVGIFIVIISIIRLQDALTFRTSGQNYRLPMFMSLVGIFTGVLCILGKLFISDVIMQILGVMLIIFAISNITGNITLSQLKKGK